MEKWKKRSIDLLSSLAFGCDGTPSVVPYYPQKTSVSLGEERFFRRTTPEKHGISSKRIYAMLSELEANSRANIHSIMVLCNGEVISECSRDGYSVNIAHLSHSMSKTVTGMIIGTLVSDGLLKVSDQLVDFFPEVAYRDKRFADITVQHLLNMTSGVDFAEAGSITESLWTEAFFASSMRFAPGAKFAYNSMNSYILARIVERVSGRAFGEVAEERFFAPLGIKNYFWEKSPEGTEKGGWGLYMSAESWAKAGCAFLFDGSFFGKRIFPYEWICESITNTVDTGYASGDFDYGYHLWTLREGGEYLFNGMLGQNVWVCPKNRIVVVVMSGNNELFQDSPALYIIRRYLGGRINDELYRRDQRVLREKESTFLGNRRFARPKAQKRGITRLFGIVRRDNTDTSFADIAGEYKFGKNNVGLLPLVVRAMQNNLDSSLESMTLRYEGGELWFIVKESGEEHKIGVGIYGYKSGILTFRGERYIVRCMGESLALHDKVEYRIELIFPELPNTRMIRLVPLGEGRVRVELSENPNNRIAENMFLRMSEINSITSVAIEIIERRFGDGIVSGTLKKAFCPTLVGIDTRAPEYQKMLDDESERQISQSRAVKMIRMVVNRFFKDTPSASSGDKSGQDTPES